MDTSICDRCPLNREVTVILEHHERRISAAELDLKKINDFVVESRLLRQMTLGGGFLSIVTLAITLFNLLSNAKP
jgi:hypothetical protein